MASRHLGIRRALGWERTADGVAFHCVTEGLAAASVTLHAVGPRMLRVRLTPGARPTPKTFTYVIDRPDPGRFTVDEEGSRVTLRTGLLAVEATLDPWQLVFRSADGQLLTEEVPDDVNFGAHRLGPPPGFEAETQPHDPLRRALGTVETLLLDPDDHFYGTGERFTRLDLVGRTVRIWNRNPYGSRSELAYKNIPLIVGTRGYGLFVDVPTAVTFHLGTRSMRAYTVEAEGPELDYYLIAGTPKEILGAYTDLTGKPAVPPDWAFGLWGSTAFLPFTEASALEQARRLRAEGIPCDVMNLDCFWQRQYMWCDFEWDRSRIPDPGRLMAALHRDGFRVCLWINPYVSIQSALYREGAARGFFLRRPDGSVYEAIVWNPRSERGMGLCAIVDFSHPEAVRWFRGKLDAQLALGADTFKPDFAEEIPEDAVFHDGHTGVDRHNPYPLVYQREAFEAVRARAGRGIVWSRSAAPGVQRYPGHWAGDSECTFPDLANTLRGGLAASMSGLAHWSHDIGGFWGTPTPELYARWAQCGLLSSLARYHGATARDPWLFGPEVLAIFREYARLRSRLIPYLESLAWEAADTGTPLMRPMVVEFPDDPAGYAFDLQYCLGDALLVSPVVHADGWVTTYLPRGRWRDWWSGNIHQGPVTLRRQVPLSELPLYLREDHLLVLGPERSHVGERPADPLTVEALVSGAAAHVLRREGSRVTLRCRREGAGLAFEADAAEATYVLRAHGHAAPRAVTADGEAVARVERGALEAAARGWLVDAGTVIVKARARRIQIEGGLA
jgi:alpha-D-xyloside xylohydrolase